MRSQLPRRPGGRALAAVAAVAALGLGAAACSSSSSGSPASGSSGKVTISINCAPAAAQFPVQHRQWLADVATFEKANPTITLQSIFNYPCEAPATFTAMLRARTQPNVFYTYLTDFPPVLLGPQAAGITPYRRTQPAPP